MSNDQFPRIGETGEPLIYYGDHRGWYIVASRHYDCDPVTDANFRTLAESLGIERIEFDAYETEYRDNATDDQSETAAIESYGGAFGRGQWLLIDPDSAESMAIVQNAYERMADYPILDEERWSDIETEREMESVTQALTNRYLYAAMDSDMRKWIAFEFLGQCNDPSRYVDAWPQWEHNEYDARWDIDRQRGWLARAICNTRREMRNHRP